MKFQRSFLYWGKKKKIGGWKNNSWRWNGKNQRNRKGRKELTPSKITIRKVGFFFFLFFFFEGTHTRTRWNWVDLNWIQSVLTHSVHPSMAPLTSSITFTCTHAAVRGSRVIDVSPSFWSLVLCWNSTEPPFVNILIKSL